MAMEKTFTVRDTHSRAITALGYNPLRREIMAGFEDGAIKVWESEGSKMVLSSWEHRGWVTSFLYWSEAKLMLSSSNDGTIVVWGSGGGVHDIIKLGLPVYSITLNLKRHQLICGFNSCIRVYSLDEAKECGHVVNKTCVFSSTKHQDIVNCLVCHESRVYSAGYDSKLIIYDSSSYPGSKSLKIVFCNPKAHEAGISCLLLVKDSDNNNWILTGSFDKTVKIWSQDGVLTNRLDGFLSTVTSMCYVPRNRTIWIASGLQDPSMFDPKSGENVSEFVHSNNPLDSPELEKYHLQLLKYCPEINQVIGSTSRRHMIIWKYNPSGCITTLHCLSTIESLTYTKKIPILYFGGRGDGNISKWERHQANHFLYSKDCLPLTECQDRARQITKGKKSLPPPPSWLAGSPADQASYIMNAMTTTHFQNTSVLKCIFVEQLDLLLAASEDSFIYVWGFDGAAVRVLERMETVSLLFQTEHIDDLDLTPTPPQTEDSQSAGYGEAEHDSVANRVAGLICKSVLIGHCSVVNCMAVVEKLPEIYLLSGGWDRKIFIWNLRKLSLVGTFYDSSPDAKSKAELACDDIITDMDYSPARDEFAYASNDGMVYIRAFNVDGRQMVLKNTLQGHEAEITQVKWNGVTGQWVTGSEDGTIKIWSGDGMYCRQTLNTHGPVSAICIDSTNGSVVAGVQNTIKVYDAETQRIIQTNIGHSDSIRGIIHIPERHQYISGSWDKTVRVWNARRLSRQQQLQQQNTASFKVQKRASSRQRSNDPNYLMSEDSDDD